MARSTGGSGGRSTGGGGSRSGGSSFSSSSRSSGSGGRRSASSSPSSYGGSRSGLGSTKQTSSATNQRRHVSTSENSSYGRRDYSDYSRASQFGSSNRNRSSVHNHYNNYAGNGFGNSMGMPGNGFSGSVLRRKAGIDTGKLVGIVLLLLVVVVVAGVYLSSSGSTLTGVPSSTVEREPLSAGMAQGEVIVYEDATGDGDWFPDAYKMERGASTAYKLTGVKFGVYVTREINGDNDPSNEAMQEFATNLYNTWFPDDAAHVLIVVVDQPQYDGYNFWVETGYAAQTVFDKEAWGVLDAYLYTHWFDINNTASDVFGRTLSDTANRIMTVTPSFIQVVTPWIAVVVIIAVVLFAVNAIIKSSAKRKEAAAAKARADAELLSTPINGFQASMEPEDPLLDSYLSQSDFPEYVPPSDAQQDPYAAQQKGYSAQQAHQGFPNNPPQAPLE